MSEPIKVGDLVYVKVPCAGGESCGCRQREGNVFTVTELRTYPRLSLPYAFGHPGGGSACVNRLRKIPPLDELESEKQKEDLREPA